MYCQCCSCHQCWRTKDGTRICCSWSKLRRSFFFHHEFPPLNWSSSLLSLGEQLAIIAAHSPRSYAGLESRRAARAHTHTHTQTGKEKGDWDWTTRQLSAGCVSFRKDHEALFSFLTKTMKLLPPASSSEEVTRPSSARHSSETSRPSGLKLGIVRLGRAGGKVRLFNRHLDLYYIDLELTKYERSEKRSGERNSWHS